MQTCDFRDAPCSYALGPLVTVEENAHANSAAMNPISQLVIDDCHSSWQVNTDSERCVRRKRITMFVQEVWPDHKKVTRVVIFRVREVPANSVERWRSASTLDGRIDANHGLEIRRDLV